MATRRAHPSNGETATENDQSGEGDQSPPASKKFKKGKSAPMVNKLKEWATEFECSINDLVFARTMDTRDTLKELRDEFLIPKMQDLPNGEFTRQNWYDMI